MKIPKYIDDALIKRTEAARKVVKYDSIITDFIIKNRINANPDDYNSGRQMHISPYASEQAIRQVILSHKKGE